MHAPRSMQGSEIKALIVLTVFVFLSGKAYALEPVSALEDGFAVPSSGSMVEASLSYPGSESHIHGGFVSGAWSVPYGVEELAVTTCQAGINLRKAGLYISYSGSGFDLYGEEQEKLGFSFAPFKSVSAGIRIARNAMRIRGFGHASAWSSDAGVIFHPYDSVYIAGAFEDIAAAELGESHEPLDGRLRFAASWRIPEDMIFLASATKVRRFDTSFSAGFTAKLMQVLTIGVAGANEPDRFEFLCAVEVRKAVFSWRGLYHRELGMSHGFSISYGRY